MNLKQAIDHIIENHVDYGVDQSLLAVTLHKDAFVLIELSYNVQDDDPEAWFSLHVTKSTPFEFDPDFDAVGSNNKDDLDKILTAYIPIDCDNIFFQPFENKNHILHEDATVWLPIIFPSLKGELDKMFQNDQDQDEDEANFIKLATELVFKLNNSKKD